MARTGFVWPVSRRLALAPTEGPYSGTLKGLVKTPEKGVDPYGMF